MEQKLKALLGDYVFMIIVLQEENEKLKKELEECKKPMKKP